MGTKLETESRRMEGRDEKEIAGIKRTNESQLGRLL